PVLPLREAMFVPTGYLRDFAGFGPACADRCTDRLRRTTASSAVFGEPAGAAGEFAPARRRTAPRQTHCRVQVVCLYQWSRRPSVAARCCAPVRLCAADGFQLLDDFACQPPCL